MDFRLPASGSGQTEPAIVRWVLTAIALAFLGLFLVVPLAAVFVEAFRKGLRAYVAAVAEPDAFAALKLTLIAAAIAVPLNLFFGLCAAWAIGKFTFPGKNLLTTLIDLPFAVSPVVSGLVFVLLFGRQGFLRAVAVRATTSRSSSPCPASCWPRSSCRSRLSRAKSFR